MVNRSSVRQQIMKAPKKKRKPKPKLGSGVGRNKHGNKKMASMAKKGKTRRA